MCVSWLYDSVMESHEEAGSRDMPESLPRRFPAWVQLSVIGVAMILICAVVGGMFLY